MPVTGEPRPQRRELQRRVSDNIPPVLIMANNLEPEVQRFADCRRHVSADGVRQQVMRQNHVSWCSVNLHWLAMLDWRSVDPVQHLSLIHISEPTRRTPI